MEIHHRLWLIYCQLKDAEADADRRQALVEKCRLELGQIINTAQASHYPTMQKRGTNA